MFDFILICVLFTQSINCVWCDVTEIPIIDKDEISLLEAKKDDQGKWNNTTSQNKIIVSNSNISKFVELILVVDKRMHEELGNDEKITNLFCINITNILNWMYQPLNISIALVQVVIWSQKDEIEISQDSDRILHNFLKYRRTVLNLKYPNDNAQLITGIHFENGIVAKAIKGTICTHEYSGGINMGNFSPLLKVANIIAHSLGHNIGMEHDTKGCSCPKDLCIMTTIILPSFTPTSWSSCSEKSAIEAFKRGMDYCLQNKPQSLFNGPVCGNGFLEPGEECDCGPEEYCYNNCCDAVSCKLKENAVCAAGECCSIKLCKLTSEKALCRPAKGECDLPEYCTAESAFCPDDEHKMNTRPCGNGKAFCYQGICKSRNNQCKLLWGSSGRNAKKKCYSTFNKKGNRHGHCGYNKLNQTYSKCEEKDVRCGLLHCTHLNDKLEFGLESLSILSHTFLNDEGEIHPCRSATIDLGNEQIDPGLTPNGAKCGENMMCLNQKCRNIDDIRKEI